MYLKAFSPYGNMKNYNKKSHQSRSKGRCHRRYLIKVRCDHATCTVRNGVADRNISRLMAAQKRSLVLYLLSTVKYRVIPLYITTFFQSYGPSVAFGWFDIFRHAIAERLFIHYYFSSRSTSFRPSLTYLYHITAHLCWKRNLASTNRLFGCGLRI